MLGFTAHLFSGHYRVPGAVANMGTARSFDIAPPSTMMGFFESACGEVGTFNDSNTRFAYGWVRRPAGQGYLLRKDHVWVSGTKGYPKSKHEASRPVRHQTFYDMVYQVVVEGSFEERLRRALRGDVERFGVLSLGESSNVVNWTQEGPVVPTEWVVPGRAFALTMKVARGYRNLSPTYRSFGLTAPTSAVPEEAWLTL